MPSITFKGLSPSLHRALKTRAAFHQRSLNQEVISILNQAVLPARKIDVEAMLAEEKRFRDALRFVVTTEDIDVAKREGRP